MKSTLTLLDLVNATATPSCHHLNKGIPYGKNDKKALAAALSQLERQFGKGTLMRLGDNAADLLILKKFQPALSLDIALGIGGLPKGRIIEIYGPESSGKTTLALQVIAEAQKKVEPLLLLMRNTHWILIMQSA